MFISDSVDATGTILQFNGFFGKLDDLVDNTTDAIGHLSVLLEIECTRNPFPTTSEKFLPGFGINSAVLHPRNLVIETLARQLNPDLSDTNCHIFTQP